MKSYFLFCLYLAAQDSNNLLYDISIELLGGFLTAMVVFLFYTYVWKDKQREAFQKNITPTLESLKELRSQEKITREETRKLVIELAENLGEKYLSKSRVENWLDHSELEHYNFDLKPIDQSTNCAICDLRFKLAKDKITCEECKLGCGLWYKPSTT